MSIQERKFSVIERIMHLGESDLQRIESVLREDAELDAALDKSINQVATGKVKPHEEVRKKYEKWL